MFAAVEKLGGWCYVNGERNRGTVTLFQVARVFYSPAGVFREVAEQRPSARAVFFKCALWLGLAPPVCAFFGAELFGWRLGVGEPVRLEAPALLAVSGAYYLALLCGFFLTAFLTRWMAPTYGASAEPGLHAALAAMVGAPLMAGGFLHLYPLLPLNLLCLIPALVWSAYLLFTGLPVLLGTDPGRGMLMAASVLAAVFSAAVALAAITMILWTHGAGPDIGFNWRSSVGG